MSAFPVLMHTALDVTDCRGLAEFYRQFLGLRYRPGDEVPADGNDDDADWLVRLDPAGHRVLAFQELPALARPTWPDTTCRSRCITTSARPPSRNCSVNGSVPRNSGPPC